MDELISIVVPVYNVERYLRQCLDSISTQNYENLEIILVDDGSTDRSWDICEEYAGKDKRFCAVHQENAGVRAARWTGVQRANGTYIGFVDSDDWIAPETYRELYDMAEATQAEIVMCGMYIYDDALKTCHSGVPPVDAGYYSDCRSESILNNLFFQKDYVYDGLSLSLWDKLIRRELVVNNYGRVDARLHYFEDNALALFCLMQARGIAVCSKPLYYYRQREKSACHSVDPTFLEQVSIFCQTVYPVVNDFSEKLVEKLSIFIANRIITGTSRTMGLKLKREIPYWLPPFSKLEAMERVVLYGAGDIGKSYWSMFSLARPDQIVLWVDRKYDVLRKEGLPVEGVEALKDVAFDRILIAVKFQNSADAIKKDLLDMGIASEAIIWEKPETIFSV